MQEFIVTFQDKQLSPDIDHGIYKYLIALQRIADNESKVIEIEMEDLEHYFSGDDEE